MSIDDLKLLDSVDISRNPKNENRKKWIRCKEATQRYSMSRPTIVSIARDAGAVYKINAALLIDTEKLDLYLESFRIPGVVE